MRETAAIGFYGLLFIAFSPLIGAGLVLFGVCWLLGSVLRLCGVTKEMVEM